MGLLDSFLGGNSMAGDYGPGEAPNNPGLLGNIGTWMRDPRNAAGLMEFGRALAQAGAPSLTPKGSFAGGLSEALAGFSQGRERFDQGSLQKLMQQLQQQKLMEDVRKSKTINDTIANGLSGQVGGSGQGSRYPDATIESASIAGNTQMQPDGLDPIMRIAPFLALAKDDPKAAFEMAIKRREGVKQDAGAYYTDPLTQKRTFLPDPVKGFTINNGIVSTLPGFNEANTTSKAAETVATEGAKSNFELVDVPDGRGGMIKMPKAIAITALGGAGSKADSPLSPSIPGGFGRALSKAEEAAAVGRAALPSSAIETGNKNFMEKDYTPTIESGKNATAVMNQTQIARKSLEGMGGSNWAKPAVVAGAKVLNALGIPKAEIIASNGELFQSALYNHVLTKQLDQKGPQTESDAKRMQMTYAQLGNTTRANQFLLDAIEAQAQLEKMRESFYRKALPIAQANGDVAEIGREWAGRQPFIFDLPIMAKWK